MQEKLEKKIEKKKKQGKKERPRRKSKQKTLERIGIKDPDTRAKLIIYYIYKLKI